MPNDTMRQSYRELSDAEKEQMQAIKSAGAALHDLIAGLAEGGSREISLAKTKVEEAVMWAVKHITG